LGYLLHVAREFESAAAQLQHAIDLDPTFFFSYWMFSHILVLTGRIDEAVAAAEKANELSGRHSLTLGALGSAYGRAGRTAEARQVLVELTARRRSTFVPAHPFTLVHGGLGEQEEALAWMARGIDERDPTIVTVLKTAPGYDPLRSRPAFQALLRRMNLEP
jgi:tetratricopeptide (TPR) repeat protein